MRFVIQLVITVLVLASLWKVFVKAGQPGWAAIIPFYNAYILAKIAGKPDWWLILFLIPIVNIIPCIAVAEKFGKTAGFGVGLGLLGVIFFPILGFGDARYLGADHVSPSSAPPPIPQH
jgi:hypothetical protein